ncbi:MAG: hypothetical protein WBF05_17405, partial [Anaerolineales bacterium]
MAFGNAYPTSACLFHRITLLHLLVESTKLRTEAINIYRRMLAILSKNNQFEIIQDHPKSNARVIRLSGTNHDLSQTCQKLE